MTRRFSVLNASTRAGALVVLLAAALLSLVCAASALALAFTRGRPRRRSATGTGAWKRSRSRRDAVHFDEFGPVGGPRRIGRPADDRKRRRRRQRPLPTAAPRAPRAADAVGQRRMPASPSATTPKSAPPADRTNRPKRQRRRRRIGARGRPCQRQRAKSTPTTALSELRQRKQPAQRHAPANAKNSGSAATAPKPPAVSSPPNSTKNHLDPAQRTPTRTSARFEVLNGQLYTSADPDEDRAKSTIATVGTGLPTTAKRTDDHEPARSKHVSDPNSPTPTAC